MSDTMVILAGNPPISVALRRSARARRLSLRVSAVDGRATLTLPQRLPRALALDFLDDRADWLRAAVARFPQALTIRAGDSLPIEGVAHEIRAAPVRSVQQDGQALLVPQGKPVGPRVAAWLKLRARIRLEAAVARHAAALGRPAGAVRLRDPRGRWGSCSARGDLMFSWRLVLAPPEVLDYVAAHEVAHLAQMNHSPAFWAEVARLMPDYARPRQWLREHGTGLMRIDFTVPA
jgi:predicted metal-dependent hydrolase